MSPVESTGPKAVPPDGGHPLAPYFPRLAIDWIQHAPGEQWRTVTGTVAFVDISGFTKLSEGLARHGKVGAEELTATIDSCFVTLLDIAVEHGGRLLKFGGDALLILFVDEEHEARACAAAVEMRRALRVVGRQTVLGQRVSLRMSVGVHSGVFHCFRVGDSHRELIVTGPGASTTVSMEGAADAGEIVISRQTAQALRSGLVGEAKGPGYLLRRPPTISPHGFRQFRAVDPTLDLLGAIPLGLRAALTGAHPVSEHRRVTVAFLHFDGTDRLIEEEGPNETAHRLEALVTIVQRAVDNQGVTFLASDVDRDGGKIILTAGAPSTSGDDDHQMLAAVREIMDAGSPVPVRIGVHRGSVFAGQVGPPYRRTFTVMGDAVNLAARLMAKASPGQILTTPEVLERSATGFAAVALEPFMVKGKSKPVQAMAVGAKQSGTGVRSTAGPSHNLDFVGRREEIRALQRVAEAAGAGQGSLVEIVGPPGVGKSRLAHQLKQITADRVQLAAACERYDSSTPYFIVRQLLRELLELPPAGNDAVVSDQFMAAVAQRAPGVLPWAPLIAGAMDLAVPETAETRELDEEFRRTRLAQAVIELLAHLLPASGLFTIEDAHFMDEASADLFGHLAASVGPTSWLWCVTRRDTDSGFVGPANHTTRLDLPPLDTDEATRLALQATRQAPLPPHELDALVERSGGNPLFLQALIAAALSGDQVEALPDSIEEVVAARIDRLPSDDRYLLRRMSVLGQSFTFDLLEDVVGVVPDVLDPTWQRLDEFVTHDGMGNLSFRNALLRDSAYDGLSFRLRRELHARAGDTIERDSLDRGKDAPELLSFHFLHAQRYGEALRYSLEAAERAKTVYANIEAAEFYERAITAGRRLPELSRSDLSAIHEALGDARNRSGGYMGAAAAYRAARRLVDDDVVTEARLILKLARVQGWLDRYANALRWISKGLRILEGAPGEEAARQRAELLGWYGRFCQEGGHHAKAITWLTLAVEQAEAVNDKEVLADALRAIDWAKMDLGQLEDPHNWERALALFEELGDLPGQAGVLNMLGMFAYFKGQWGEALELYRRAQDTVRRTGNAVMDAFYVFNIGEIVLEQGDLDTAEESFEAAWRAWQAAGYRSGVADVKGKLARVNACRGRYDDALALLAESVDEFRHIGSQADALEAQARVTECLLLSGDHARALAEADQALAQARSLGGVPPQIAVLQRVRGVALWLAGNGPAAGEALDQSLAAARTRRAEYEAALTMRVMAEVAAADDRERHRELLAAASATLTKLGVVATPDLLRPPPHPTRRQTTS